MTSRITAYHGTSSKNMHSILEHGIQSTPGQRVFDPNADFGMSPVGGAYFTTNKDTAAWFAKEASRRGGGGYDSIPIVITVSLSSDVINMDEDVFLDFLDPVALREIHLWLDINSPSDRRSAALRAVEKAIRMFVDSYGRYTGPDSVLAALAARIVEVSGMDAHEFDDDRLDATIGKLMEDEEYRKLLKSVLENMDYTRIPSRFYTNVPVGAKGVNRMIRIEDAIRGKILWQENTEATSTR